MTRRFSSLHLGLLLGGLVTAMAVGCGGDDDDNDSTPTAGTGGKGGSTSGKGGSNQGGDTSTPEGGDTSTPEGGSGGAGPTPADADLSDVVAAVCDWEFRCCDAGELRYRLNPDTTDSAACAEFFDFQLNESNSTSNPFVAGNAVGLLGVLGYNVDLTRVSVNAANAEACIEKWEALGCNEEPDPDARCDGAAAADPCSLTELFDPVLELDEQCTIELAEPAYGNDVECKPGSTCLDVGHPDNDNNFAACVKRGVAEEPCTNDTQCDYDFFCNEAGDCEEKAGAGDVCSFEDESQPAAGEEAIQCKAGLTCHPTDLTCTEPCTLGFRCAADAQCPVDTSCAPLTVENDTTSFMVCRAQGNSATARCDSDADCVATRHCDGSNVCQADVAVGIACGKTAMCPEGTHCGGVVTVCTTNLAPGAACDGIGQGLDACGPAPARCVAGLCSANTVSDGDNCDQDADCDSGLCELASAIAVATTCIAGADEGDDCDVAVGSGTATRCAPGLFCDATAKCAVQAGPGGDCEDPDLATPNLAMCTNASCLEQWDEVMCTDAPTPKSNGGSNVTCDGN